MPPEGRAGDALGKPVHVPAGRLAGLRSEVPRWRDRTDRPWLIALLALLAGALVALARLALLAHGNASWFIFAGVDFSGHAARYHPIQIFPTAGYDGQFFYRLALDPLRLGTSAFGITFDHAYRAQRIGYPVLAWVFSAGRASLVPWSLILVNILALGTLGYLGGLLAKDSGRHALFGLLLPGFWGFPFSMARDTAEIVTAAFVMAGLLALRRRRLWWATGLLSAAVLTRETALVVVAGIALHHLWSKCRHHEDPLLHGARAYAPWLVPSGVFLAWQGVVHLASGQTAATGDALRQLGAPFTAVIATVSHDVATLPSHASLLDLLELGVLVLLGVLAGLELRGSAIPGWEKVAAVLMVLLAVCLAPGNLDHRANQRSLDELYLLCVLVLLRGRINRPTAWPNRRA